MGRRAAAIHSGSSLFSIHFPGETPALIDSTVDLEDSDLADETDSGNLGPDSIAVGISASGRTPYVEGALRHARKVGALSILVTCNPHAPLAGLADISIVADTGPEVLTGSTRLKAGTATKVILNCFSTTLMIRAGRVYSNLMIGMVASNGKLRERAVSILREASGASADQCTQALADAGGDLPVALTMLLAGQEHDAAASALRENGTVRAAVAALAPNRTA